MSPTSAPSDQLVQLHARIQELEAGLRQRGADLDGREEELRRTQAGLLKAQAQILELNDLLAARDTELKNAEAAAPELQQLLDVQLARTNELDGQLRAAEDRCAAAALESAAAQERATTAERLARESVAAAQQTAESVRARLQTASAQLEEHRRDATQLEAKGAELRRNLAGAELIATANLQRAEAAEKARAELAARLKKIESHWVWRLTGPLHD